MAGFSRVHGNSTGVVNVDIADAGQTSVEVPINVAGPKLDFFAIDFENGTSPVGQMGAGGAIETVIKTVQQLATVYMYQIMDETGGGPDTQMSLAVYPVGAWTQSSLETAIRDLGTVNDYDMSDANVEDSGFALEMF